MEPIIPQGGAGSDVRFVPSVECPSWAPWAFLASLLFYPSLILLFF